MFVFPSAPPVLAGPFHTLVAGGRLWPLIPSLGNKNPFHRQDFVRWLGALRNSMPPHRIRRATTPADKSWRPSVGRIGPPAALRGLPDAGASRRAARLTGRTNAPP